MTMTTGDDNRQAPRRRALKGASAVLPGGGIIDCVVKDLSDTGARLQVVNALSLPERFELHIPGAKSIQVTVVWRKGRMIGVRFNQ
jgi:hypothetical protein